MERTIEDLTIELLDPETERVLRHAVRMETTNLVQCYEDAIISTRDWLIERCIEKGFEINTIKPKVGEFDFGNELGFAIFAEVKKDPTNLVPIYKTLLEAEDLMRIEKVKYKNLNNKYEEFRVNSLLILILFIATFILITLS